MHIKRFGIRLIRLEEEHIETVRKWRNAPQIRDFMEYREYISAEMQLQWFRSLVKLTDFYFVIEHHGKLVGLIHTSGINWKKKTGNAGLFIWDKELLGSHVPVLASLCMVDFFFSYCTLEKLFAKVMEANPVAIKYDANLGFKPAEPPNGKRFRHYSLTKADYFLATERLHEMAESVGDGVHEVAIESDLLEALKDANAIAAAHAEEFVTVIR